MKKTTNSDISKSISLIGDVVASEVILNRNTTFEEGLTILEKTLQDLFGLRQSNKKKFTDLMFKSIKEYNSETLVPSENFETIVNQLFRIYGASIQSRSASIIHKSEYTLWNSFRLCLEDAGLSNDEQFLRLFSRQIIYTAYHEINPEIRANLAVSFPRFYNSSTNILRDCPLSQLDLLNYLLFHFVVSQPENERLLKEIMHWLPNGIFAFNEYSEELWKYKDPSNEREWQQLYGTSNVIFTYQQLQEWQERLEDFSSKYSVNQADAGKLFSTASNLLKYRSLQQILFKIECFYLSQAKYDSIKMLWLIRAHPVSFLSSSHARPRYQYCL